MMKVTGFARLESGSFYFVNDYVNDANAWADIYIDIIMNWEKDCSMDMVRKVLNATYGYNMCEKVSNYVISAKAIYNRVQMLKELQESKFEEIFTVLI